MKFSEGKNTPTSQQFTVSAEESDLLSAKRAVFNELRGQVKADGFRPGKAPDNVVEQKLGSQMVQSEVLGRAVNQLFGRAVAEQKLNVIGQPDIKITKYVPYSALEFTAECEIAPTFKLPDYEKFKIEVKPQEPTDKEVDDVLQNMRSRMAKKTEVTRPAKDGDGLLLDFAGRDNKNQPLAGAKGEDFPLQLGSKTFIPGFEDKLIGLKSGEDKTFDLTFPKDYHSKNLQSAKVTFDVTVKKVYELKQPELNDAFAASASPFPKLSELKADVKKQLASEHQQQAERERREKLIKTLVEKTKIDLPPKLVDRVKEEIHKEFLRNLELRSLREEDFYKNEGTTKEKYEKTELLPAAQRRVKASLILSEVARVENLSVNREELEEYLKLLQGRYQSDPKALSELDKPEVREDVAAQLLTEKTIAKLLSFIVK